MFEIRRRKVTWSQPFTKENPYFKCCFQDLKKEIVFLSDLLCTQLSEAGEVTIFFFYFFRFFLYADEDYLISILLCFALFLLNMHGVHLNCEFPFVYIIQSLNHCNARNFVTRIPG